MNRVSVAAVLLCALVCGCGAGADGGTDDGFAPPAAHDDAQSLTAPPAAPPPAESSVQVIGVAREPTVLHPPPLTVRGHALAAADGQHVTVLSGVNSCGWLQTGKGEGSMKHGTFSAALKRTWEEFGYESLYVFIDADADGACDLARGDLLFRAPYAAMGRDIILDGATLQPGDGWECTLFSFEEQAP